MKIEMRKKLTLGAIFLVAAAIIGVLIYFGYKVPGTTGFIDDVDGPKTLWDWLDLMIVSVVLATVGFWFSSRQSHTARETTEKENQTDRLVAQNRTEEQTLQVYLDRMQELMLKENLLSARHDWPVANLARARTLTILKFFSDAQRRNTRTTTKSFGGDRRRLVMEFLYQANLITGEKPVVNLSHVDLMGIDLKWAFLKSVFLVEADLRYAKLQHAFLEMANLREARLYGARLSGANLVRATLQDADFRCAILIEANLRDANLDGTVLEEANLQEAKLEKAHLHVANLGCAYLNRANLRNADLGGANLEGADLHGVNLQGANLEETILENAFILPQQLKQVDSLNYSTLPDGTMYDGRLPEKWGDAWPYYSRSKDKW